MDDRLSSLTFYQMSLTLWDECWHDGDILQTDVRGREILKQLTRCVGSISANIEEGYGRGFGKEYPQYLRIARGSAREAKGWYIKSKYLLASDTIEKRSNKLDQIIAMINRTIDTLANQKAKK